MKEQCTNCKRDDQELVHPRVYIKAIRQYATNKSVKVCNDCLVKLQANVDLGYEQGQIESKSE